MQTKMLAYIPNFTKNHIYMYGIHTVSTAMLSTLNGVYNYCSPNSFISTDKCNIHCKTKL